MRITYFGNAMMMLESKASKVLSDPWVTFDRESTSGLYNFPELKMSREDVAALAPDFIYISHTHADHFDEVTLKLFPSSTPILIADYVHNFTERNLKAIGFTDVRVVNGTEGQPLHGDDWCWIEPNGIYPEIDSLFIGRFDGETVINLNDNVFDGEQCERLESRFAPINLLCVPFSYQGPYPAFYENLTEQERAAEAEQKKMRNYEITTRFTEILKPKRLFPFAAGAMYGGDKARLYPYYGVGTCTEAVNYASRRASFEPLILSQCSSYDFQSGEYQGLADEENYIDHLDYIEAIAQKKSIFVEDGQFWIAPSERMDLTRLLQRARVRQLVWQTRRGYVSDGVFYLDVGEPLIYRFSLCDDKVTRVVEHEIADDVFEIFRLPYSLLVGVLTGHYNWSNIKTQYVSFYRKPNVFNPDLHILMSYLQV